MRCPNSRSNAATSEASSVMALMPPCGPGAATRQNPMVSDRGWAAWPRSHSASRGHVLERRQLAHHCRVYGSREREALGSPGAGQGTGGRPRVHQVPLVVAKVVGEKLDFPQLLLLMRLFGLVAFTAAVGYAIFIPALKWSFSLQRIGMAPTKSRGGHPRHDGSSERGGRGTIWQCM
jgi:hypothetical protein